MLTSSPISVLYPIQFNGELLDPQRVYLQLAKGSYFGRDPQAQIALQEMLVVPISLEPLLWYSFYNYTVNGFELMSALFDIVRALRPHRRLSGVRTRASHWSRAVHLLHDERYHVHV